MPTEIRAVPNTPAQPGDRGSRSQGIGGPGPEPSDVRNRSRENDSVTLTDVASKLKELETALTDIPVVDAQRVSELRAAVADGRFAVNPERVAEKLIALESLLDAKLD